MKVYEVGDTVGAITFNIIVSKRWIAEAWARLKPGRVITEVDTRDPDILEVFADGREDEWLERVGITGVQPAIVSWNAGARERDVLADLFEEGFVEPHVTWASDLGWRVTADGKKAGLK